MTIEVKENIAHELPPFHSLTDDTLARAAATLGDDTTAFARRGSAVGACTRLGASWWGTTYTAPSRQARCASTSPTSIARSTGSSTDRHCGVPQFSEAEIDLVAVASGLRRHLPLAPTETLSRPVDAPLIPVQGF